MRALHLPDPVPFADRPRHIQIVLVAVAPALLGIVAGVLLGVSAVAYVVVGVIAGVGAFLSGLEHPDAWSGADRGFAGGAVYGIALLLAHAVAGTHATVSLGSFPPGLVLITALAGMFLAAAGATRDARHAARA